MTYSAGDLEDHVLAGDCTTGSCETNSTRRGPLDSNDAAACKGGSCVTDAMA